ncbi:heterokaryon incompatibility protein-domain-containing protein [Epithele typhae]|uniref:heterokaryon incompatibility protein-domain-containing protein n=1 Tax=Epithele typhae TaxID=378194 RepID=UPI0020085337|nr:heterokaryon incompatibility protein-domain-containing protein [Epithele typhae]KAH9903880.1 heterokaryon incompatibility protein-domain-containing protein [Epithele typhae]
MWLLGTARANLVFFPQPEDVPRGYAILSHTWGEEEETFQKVQRLNEESNSPFSPEEQRPLPRAELRSLISQALVEQHGYEYAWVDTCCINKDSSSELSEGINSMFRYYALSNICYVYLSDVQYSDTDSDKMWRAFRDSRWHERGWTLQELIASRILVFYSKEWIYLGTKYELADRLEKATKISAEVLRFEPPFTDETIATRISWAARRSTTRPEDAAYSLFGLFGVNMPTLYGEGRLAFCRLLMEISKTSQDPSIFLLGERRHVNNLDDLKSYLPRNPQSQPRRHLLPLQPSWFLRSVFYDASARSQTGQNKVRWYGYHSTLRYIDDHLSATGLQGRPQNSVLPRSPFHQIESSSARPFCLWMIRIDSSSSIYSAEIPNPSSSCSKGWTIRGPTMALLRSTSPRRNLLCAWRNQARPGSPHMSGR